MSRELDAPAFPSHGSMGEVAEQGMWLRDFFAAKAMQSIRQDATFLLRHDPDQVADRAYEMADAMLRARQS